MTTEICIYGDIGYSWWEEDGITESTVLDGLKSLDPAAAVHTVHINSCGGNCDTGIAILNILRSHKAQMKAVNADFKLKTINDAYAMSIASVIMMAGDIRVAALGSTTMIHDAWSGCWGNADEMRKAADVMDKMSDNIATIYATLCTPAAKDTPVRDAAYFRNYMKEETYMINDEALKCGLVTEIDTGLIAVAHAALSPEKLKGHYALAMKASAKKRTFSRPTAAKSVTDSKVALQRFTQLVARMG